MTFGELWNLLSATPLSPEMLSPYLGVSNMTLRRWKSMPASEPIPPLYVRGITEGVYQLLLEEKLDPHAPAVQKFLKRVKPVSFDAALRSMGWDPKQGPGEPGDSSAILRGLSAIGMDLKRQRHVQSEQDGLLRKMRRMGVIWRERIDALLKIIRSREIPHSRKLVAFGALFYLLAPIDLIPDHIPVIGFIDDF